MFNQRVEYIFLGGTVFQTTLDWSLRAVAFANSASVRSTEVCGRCLCLQGIQRKRPSEVQSALLRRHLLELTQSFIIPLVS